MLAVTVIFLPSHINNESHHVEFKKGRKGNCVTIIMGVFIQHSLIIWFSNVQ